MLIWYAVGMIVVLLNNNFVKLLFLNKANYNLLKTAKKTLTVIFVLVDGGHRCEGEKVWWWAWDNDITKIFAELNYLKLKLSFHTLQSFLKTGKIMASFTTTSACFLTNVIHWKTNCKKIINKFSCMLFYKVSK